MTKDKTVTFAKAHIYGGHPFKPGEKLTLPIEKAEVLKAAGVLEAEKKKAK